MTVTVVVRGQVSEGNCANEVSRAVRMALWQYRKGAAMTAVCDEDAATCQPPSGRTLRSVGVVGVFGIHGLS